MVMPIIHHPLFSPCCAVVVDIVTLSQLNLNSVTTEQLEEDQQLNVFLASNI